MKPGQNINLVPAKAHDFEIAYPLLSRFNNPHIHKKEWKNLFETPFPNENENVGYFLVDGSSIVGFMGCIYSNRIIRNQQIKFCNLSSWIVLPEYRSHSMLFIKKLFDLDDYVLTTFSPNQNVIKFYKRLGFLDFETSSFYILPKPFMFKPKALLYSDPDEFVGELPSNLKSAYSHHSKTDDCYHYLIKSKSESCYIACNRRPHYFNHFRIRVEVPVSVILHVSNPDLFSSEINSISWKLTKSMRTRLINVDSRFITKDDLGFALKRPLTRMYRPAKNQNLELKPFEIDALYSEFVCLNLHEYF